jgi:hypothetical protein
MRLARTTVGLTLAGASFLIAPHPAGAQFFEYTITPLSPTVQTQDVIDFTAPYYYYLLTNDGLGSDSYFLEVRNLSVSPNPNWFPQVCLRQVCFPETTTIMLAGGASDTIGVNVVPFSNGVGTFDFHVQSVGDPGAQSDFTGLKLFAGTAAVGVDGSPGRALTELSLAQNVPNPARGGTRISFALPAPAPVSLQVFDVGGRLVRTLTERRLETGTHSVAWDALGRSGHPVPAGVYYYRLSTPEETRTKRLTVIR